MVGYPATHPVVRSDTANRDGILRCFCTTGVQKTAKKGRQGNPADLVYISVVLDHAAVDGIASEHLFDTQKLVVFADAVGTGERAGFDLSRISGDGDVRDGGILGFT